MTRQLTKSIDFRQSYVCDSLLWQQYCILSDLEPAVQTAGYGDTLAGLAGAAERLFQRLNRSLRLLQLLHQRVHRLFFGPVLPTLDKVFWLGAAENLGRLEQRKNSAIYKRCVPKVTFSREKKSKKNLS